jgi:hypothetical protein
MKPADDIHRMIKKMQLKASADLDRRVHNDISKALAESEKTESTHTEPNIWRWVPKGGIIKLAVAAAIFITFGIGFFTGRWSKPPQPAPPSRNITGYTTVVPIYSTTPKAEDSFWRQKALAAMKPRPYAQNLTNKTSLLNAYKQYLKEKHYD